MDTELNQDMTGAWDQSFPGQMGKLFHFEKDLLTYLTRVGSGADFDRINRSRPDECRLTNDIVIALKAFWKQFQKDVLPWASERIVTLTSTEDPQWQRFYLEDLTLKTVIGSPGVFSGNCAFTGYIYPRVVTDMSVPLYDFYKFEFQGTRFMVEVQFGWKEFTLHIRIPSSSLTESLAHQLRANLAGKIKGVEFDSHCIRDSEGYGFLPPNKDEVWFHIEIGYENSDLVTTEEFLGLEKVVYDDSMYAWNDLHFVPKNLTCERSLLGRWNQGLQEQGIRGQVSPPGYHDVYQDTVRQVFAHTKDATPLAQIFSAQTLAEQMTKGLVP